MTPPQKQVCKVEKKVLAQTQYSLSLKVKSQTQAQSFSYQRSKVMKLPKVTQQIAVRSVVDSL